MTKKSKKQTTPKPRYTKKASNPKGSGRKRKPINWDAVRNLCVKHFTQAEIAATLNINITTLKDRCIIDNGIEFSKFYKTYLSVGKGSVRAKSWDMAMEGNVAMLSHLNKHVLGQFDKQEIEVNIKPFVIESPNGNEVLKVGVDKVDEIEGEVIDIEVIEDSENTYYTSDELAKEGEDHEHSTNESGEPG